MVLTGLLEAVVDAVAGVTLGVGLVTMRIALEFETKATTAQGARGVTFCSTPNRQLPSLTTHARASSTYLTVLGRLHLQVGVFYNSTPPNIRGKGVRGDSSGSVGREDNDLRAVEDLGWLISGGDRCWALLSLERMGEGTTPARNLGGPLPPPVTSPDPKPVQLPRFRRPPSAYTNPSKGSPGEALGVLPSSRMAGIGAGVEDVPAVITSSSSSSSTNPGQRCSSNPTLLKRFSALCPSPSFACKQTTV
ncbi:hypothetical protein FA13DRAFT_1715651 [Coprinellus micaceus]|uniref:Uncharacterized protein n=1 Tax=Coprinellus micaceus TaxID=71717 RepID=A0A4Y7SMG0_COPMI|nr:hypothetical protein FA13DRAFT_1715651 [Coprinellus micaceus]